MKYTPTSLYSRLNPKHLEYLLSSEPSHPIIINQVLHELQTNVSWTRLSYHTVCELVIWLGLRDYSPTSIDSLFTNK